jgi:UDP:flavonoid glycosyltransferase YjiC (YdhE family)
MSNIAFMMHAESGHLNPSFKLAGGLRAKGHRVYYFGLPKARTSTCPVQEIISAQGFDYILLGGSAQSTSEDEEANVSNINPLSSHLKQSLRDRSVELGIDLFVIDNLFPNVALSVKEMGTSVVLINVSLWNLVKETEIIERYPFLKPVARMPELVLCPKEFEFADSIEAKSDLNYHYIEPCINFQRKEEFDWHLLNDKARLIYCSLGSQNYLYAESRAVFQAVIDAARERPDAQFVVALGRELKAADFRNVPANVILAGFAPQLDMLKKAWVMITHGGLNGIKEAIMFQVPMIVFPFVRDQPMNAARIEHHGLGVTANPKRASAELVLDCLSKIENNPAFRTKVQQMGRRFREIEASGKGVRLIQSFLTAKSHS